MSLAITGWVLWCLFVSGTLGIVLHIIIEPLQLPNISKQICCIFALISFVFLVCFWTPIRETRSNIKATITKMEETTTSSGVYRHVYAITEDDEALCLTVTKSDYARLNEGDLISIERTEEEHLIGEPDISYTLNQ